ncbi:cyclase family protein [Sutterella sp.]|uniref:cyclase family protein n=1 Tax=Sutterella sp. TaxID=1981025 RepID=UPI0026DF16B4|nr:cyclase family protein [Sutterella sp.]MDO5530612.1 cyclase family protein [Sutterella sp.]
MASRRIWDITPPLGKRTPVFPGDTPFQVYWNTRISDGDPSNVSTLTFSPHIGAHADAPLHLDRDAADAAALRLETFIGRCVVIDLSDETSLDAIGPESVDLTMLPSRVLFKTRRQRPWQWTDQFRALKPQLVRDLAAEGVGLIGVDTPSIDPAASTLLVSHRIALSNRMALLENLDLAEVPAGEYELIALPLPIEGVEATPVRAILRALTASGK